MKLSLNPRSRFGVAVLTAFLLLFTAKFVLANDEGGQSNKFWGSENDCHDVVIYSDPVHGNYCQTVCTKKYYIFWIEVSSSDPVITNPWKYC